MERRNLAVGRRRMIEDLADHSVNSFAEKCAKLRSEAGCTGHILRYQRITRRDPGGDDKVLQD